MPVYGRPVTGCRAVASQSFTIAANSSVVVPACVAITISAMACSPPASALATSPLQQGREGLLRLPLGVLRGERLDAVERERELDVHRLLGPQRAVVVEHGDALGGRHVAGRALLRHLGDEGDDRLPGRTVVPGRQRIGRRRGRRAACQQQADRREASEKQTSARHVTASKPRRSVTRPACGGVEGCRRARYGRRGFLSLAGATAWSRPSPTSITRSRLKLPGFWRGGNSLKLCSHLPT